MTLSPTHTGLSGGSAGESSVTFHTTAQAAAVILTGAAPRAKIGLGRSAIFRPAELSVTVRLVGSIAMRHSLGVSRMWSRVSGRVCGG